MSKPIQKAAPVPGDMLQIMVSGYCYWILGVFPVYFGTSDLTAIAAAKYNFFRVSAAAFLILYGITILSLVFIREIPVESPLYIWKKSSLTQKAVWCYLAVAVLSSVLSPWREMVWLGFTKREGLFTTLLYGLSFLAVSYHYKFRRSHICILGISSAIVAGTVILQRMGWNPFYLYPEGVDYYHNRGNDFMGTIGHVNYLAAFLAIGAAVCLLGALLLENKRYRLLAVPGILCLGGLYIAHVDAGVAALAAVTVSMIYLIGKSKRYRRNAAIGILFCILAVLGILYFYDFGGEGTLYELHQLLHGSFDDSYGTLRGFIWRRSCPLVLDYPVLGSGPDTFVKRFMTQFFDQLPAEALFSFVDTAENEYITIAVNLGLWGLASYLTAILSQSVRIIRVSRENTVILILAGAVIAYWARGFFSNSLMVVTPVYWVLWGMLEGMIKEQEGCRRE